MIINSQNDEVAAFLSWPLNLSIRAEERVCVKMNVGEKEIVLKCECVCVRESVKNACVC